MSQNKSLVSSYLNRHLTYLYRLERQIKVILSGRILHRSTQKILDNVKRKKRSEKLA